MTRTRKRILIGVVAAVVVVLIVMAMRPEAVEVETVSIGRGPIRVTVDAEGTTRVEDRYTISAPAAGVVQRITLQQGDTVRAGGVVARLAPVPLDPASRAQAQAQLSSARSLQQAAETAAQQAAEVVAQARRTAERLRTLHAAGGTSRQSLDDAELALATAERQHEGAVARARAAASDVQAIRAQLAANEGGGGTIVVRAPVGGRVLRVHERSQRAVQPGTPLLDIGDPAELEVVADVLSTDAVRIRPGQLMLLEDWGGLDTLRAVVRTVGPAAITRISALGVEEQRVEIVGNLSDPPPELGDEYRVTARVVVWERPNELRVPTAALFRRDGDWMVFRIVDGRASAVSLRIGERGAEWAQVLAGLEEGDQVVLYPSDRVTEGAQVVAR